MNACRLYHYFGYICKIINKFYSELQRSAGGVYAILSIKNRENDHLFIQKYKNLLLIILEVFK